MKGIFGNMFDYYHVLYQTYFTKIKTRNRDCVTLELEKLGYFLIILTFK